MLQPHFTLHPFAPLRGAASDAAEMISQLLFGDLVEVLETDKQWRRIRNQADGYEGWVDEKALVAVDAKWLDGVEAWQFVVSDGEKLEMRHPKCNSVLPLSLGARIPTLKNNSGKPLEIGAYQIDLAESLDLRRQWPLEDLVALSAKYLGTPYLWGGKSLAGIDCSGFTQMVFAMCGIQLPRDAALQIVVGQTVDFAARKPGDLAFFANPMGKVTHVGIVLAGNEIRHAAGTVHDDWLDAAGIQNKITEKQTHTLVSIKRIF